MKIFSSGIVNGYIQDRFGKHAEETQKKQEVPIYSLPITWEDLPEGTQSLVLIMQDYDAAPVCGFSWIHWLVADIDPQSNGLEENASQTNLTLIQGKNSIASKQICGDMPDEITQYYCGPRPPDADHEYEVMVYALDTKLNLKPGFYVSELIKAMRGHVLDSAALVGIYRT